MATTTRGFRYPVSTDTPDVPRDIGNLAADIDAMFITGAVGSRPAFGKVGREHYDPATGLTTLDIGTAWVLKGASDLVRTGDTRITADQAVGTASIRTLGTGAQQAAPGNHNHDAAYQPLDSDLTAIAALATTATGRSLLAAADAAAIRAIAGSAQANIPTVTSLPGSPVDGQEIYYVADATNGIVWHLKYRSASGSAYKWEFIGGGSLTALVATDQTFAADSTNRDPATVGPSITLPLAGDYEYVGSANMYNAGVANAAVALLSNLGGTDLGATAGHQETMQLGVAGGSSTLALAAASPLTGVTAAQVLKLRYWGSGGGNANTRWRKLRARPVRVG